MTALPENIPDLFIEPMQSFRLLKLYIKNNCKDSYCKILENGVEYRFYTSSQQQEQISLYSENIADTHLINNEERNLKEIIDDCIDIKPALDQLWVEGENLVNQ